MEVIPVPLLPKVCKVCKIEKKRLDFSGANTQCLECARKKRKKLAIKQDSPEWGKSTWYAVKRCVDRL